MKSHFLALHIPFLVLCLLLIFAVPVQGGTWKVYTERTGWFSKGPLPSNTVQTLWTDGQNLWVGTYEGLVKFNGEKWSPVYKGNYWKVKHGKPIGYKGNVPEIPDNRVNCIEYVGDKIWFGTDKGIITYDTQRGTWEPQVFHFKTWDNGYIQVLFKEHNRVWIGNWGTGLAYYDLLQEKLKVISFNEGFKGKLITGITLFNQALWVGTLDGGMNRLNLHTGNWINRRTDNSDFPSNAIKAMAATEKPIPQIWFATDKGVLRFIPSEEKSSMSMIFTGEHFKLPSDDITALLIDNEDIWVATRAGLCRYSDREWITISLPHQVSGYRITSIIKYKDALWFGFQHGGVASYLP